MFGQAAYEEVHRRNWRAKNLESPWGLTNLLGSSITSYRDM
jgi:hypothetical protein